MSAITKELFRKLVHLLEVPIIFAYAVISRATSHRAAILALTALLLVLLEIEYIRIDYHTKFGRQITDFFSKSLLRKHERNNVISSIFFIISTIIAFSVFEYRIALLCLLLTVFGDLAAAICGTLFGEKKIFRTKSYIGSAAGLIANLIVGIIVLPQHPEIIIPMALTATAVETLTQKLNDNLTVPLFSGFVGEIIVFFYHIPLPPLL